MSSSRMSTELYALAFVNFSAGQEFGGLPIDGVSDQTNAAVSNHGRGRLSRQEILQLERQLALLEIVGAMRRDGGRM